MGDWGIRASAPGTDIATAESKDLVIDSTKKCLKMNSVVADTITTSAGGVAEETIAHGLTFRPVAILAINYDGAYYFAPFHGQILVPIWFYCTIDATNINIQLSAFSDPSTTFDIYYWVSESESAS